MKKSKGKAVTKSRAEPAKCDCRLFQIKKHILCADFVIDYTHLAETGKFKPLIDRNYPLDEIKEAYQYVESRQKIGNRVLSIISE